METSVVGRCDVWVTAVSARRPTQEPNCGDLLLFTATEPGQFAIARYLAVIRFNVETTGPH